MKTLPTEILSQIFILLYQQDQLECMLTCRLWKNIIENSCLFQTLQAYSYSSLEKIWNKIQDQPNLGKNVDQLILYLYDAEEIDLSSFLEKLPDIRKLRICFTSRENLYIDNSLTFPWYSHIESIEEVSYQPIVISLLSNNVFSNLTFLRVSDSDKYIIPLLKNAPVLKVFILEADYIEFVDINNIHENSPNLKTLQLENATIYGDGIERIITPANSIVKVSLIYIRTSSLDMELELLQFITAKYPNLVELVHGTYYSPGNREDEDILYNDGWDPLLKNLGPQLKKLQANYLNVFQNFLPVLDMHNCQIEYLKIHCFSRAFLSHFAQSQQSLYIRTLILSHTHFDSITWLKELKLLEILEISSGGYEKPLRLDFNDILNNSPCTLKSLTFRNVSLTGDIVNTRQYTLKDLSFIECSVPEKIIRFIDRHFPFITNLKIKNCRNLPKKIVLRSAELESFCFNSTDKKGRIYVLVRTIYNDEERYYFTGEKRFYFPFFTAYSKFDDSEFQHIKSLPADSINLVPFITLYCFTVKKVILCI